MRTVHCLAAGRCGGQWRIRCPGDGTGLQTLARRRGLARRSAGRADDLQSRRKTNRPAAALRWPDRTRSTTPARRWPVCRLSRVLMFQPNAPSPTGLRHIHWPSAAAAALTRPGGLGVWLDGAHNENGAHALAAQMAQWQKQDGKKLHLVFGIMQRKDAAAFLKHLMPGAASVTAVGIAGEPLAHSADTLAAALKKHWSARHARPSSPIPGLLSARSPPRLVRVRRDPDRRIALSGRTNAVRTTG